MPMLLLLMLLLTSLLRQGVCVLGMEFPLRLVLG
jgi:hypothetical protein